MKRGKNLFNKDSANHVYGKYIRLDGTIIDNEETLITEYIPVKPTTKYCFRFYIDGMGCALYDKNFNIISVVPVNTLETTDSTAWIRFSMYKIRLENQQMEEGVAFTSYEPYVETYDMISEHSLQNKSVSTDKLQDSSVVNSKIAVNAISFDKIGFTKHGINVINTEDADVVSGYINGNSVVSNSSYITSGFFRVAPGEGYVVSYNGNRHHVSFVGYYDNNKKNISIVRDKYSFEIPENVSYARISILTQYFDLLQIEKGNTISPYEKYYSYIGKEYLEETLGINSVSGENIKDSSVSPNKTTFFKNGKNLVDISSDNVALGKYVDSTGSLYSNAAYNTTDYIAVESGKTYRIGASDKESLNARTLATYDKDFKITGNYYSNINKLVVPDGVCYIRASLYAESWSYAQITEGEEKIPYEKFAVIASEYLPTSGNGGVSEVLMYVPKHIYVAAGRTIELYYDQIILNAHKYNIQASCSIGKALDRKFQVIGDANKLGDYTLTINVIDDNGNKIATDTGTIHVVSNTINSTYSIVPFGDSLTNDKPWGNEVTSLSGNKIVMKGTRHSKHEGRSGASVSTYLSKTGGILYNYDDFYSGVGLDAPIFDASKSYSKDDLVRYPATFGTGDSGYHVYAFKNAHSGEWNTSDVVCISGGNPLFDYKNNKISLGWYKSFQNIQCDAIIIYLGTNGISLSPETNTNGSLGIKTLIDELRQEDTTTPIIVVNTIFRSSQNGIGNQGNTDGYKAQTAFKFEEDKKVLLLAKSIYEMIGSYDNVYIAPVGATHDSKYNFGNVKKAVNPRLEATENIFELYPSDSVHPQNSGYYQMADTIYSTICAIINK